jgi:Fe-S cluster biogenesis protein NfuA
VSDLAAQVTDALRSSILPSVIARGGTIRVAAAADGIVTLEVTGSPGAVFPLAARIEAMIRGAVPGVTAVRLVTPGTRPSGSPAGAAADLAEVTVRQGIEPLLRARLPAMTGLADVTDHEAGTEPFFSPEKR